MPLDGHMTQLGMYVTLQYTIQWEIFRKVKFSKNLHESDFFENDWLFLKFRK